MTTIGSKPTEYNGATYKSKREAERAKEKDRRNTPEFKEAQRRRQKQFNEDRKAKAELIKSGKCGECENDLSQVEGYVEFDGRYVDNGYDFRWVSRQKKMTVTSCLNCGWTVIPEGADEVVFVAGASKECWHSLDSSMLSGGK